MTNHKKTFEQYFFSWNSIQINNQRFREVTIQHKTIWNILWKLKYFGTAQFKIEIIFAVLIDKNSSRHRNKVEDIEIFLREIKKDSKQNWWYEIRTRQCVVQKSQLNRERKKWLIVIFCARRSPRKNLNLLLVPLVS